MYEFSYIRLEPRWIRLPALNILFRASRPPARSPAHPCARFTRQGLRLCIVTGTLRFESIEVLLIMEDFFLRFFFFLSRDGFVFQSQTSCLLLPDRLRVPRRIHAPDSPVKACALALLQERFGSNPSRIFIIQEIYPCVFYFF